MKSILERQDPPIAAALKREAARQENHLVLIAAENYASPAVLEAQGSVFTNKYAEGYPGHRYYTGCQDMDAAEALAIQRAKDLFGADHANVQPHSGTQANLAVYSALLSPGDVVMAMRLAEGGHLSHGSPANCSGHWYCFSHYGVDSTSEKINYDDVEKIARDHRPKLIMAGASAYPRIIDFGYLRRIADMVGAVLVADIAHIAGLVAAGCHPSPVGCAQIITSSTHKTLRGPRGGFILCDADFASKIDKAVFPGMQGGPLMHVVAAKAVAFQEALLPEFTCYQQAVVDNANILAQELTSLGFRLVSGGTDNHLVLVDLRSLNITGREAELALERACISVNRNSIPFDTLSPNVTSGIRLGTPAITTRGLGRSEMKEIARMIFRILGNIGNDEVLAKVCQQVGEMTREFPVPKLVCRS